MASTVCVHGLFPRGIWPDMKTLKSRPASVSPRDETDVADSWYQHQEWFTLNNVNCKQKAIHARVRALHKSCSARFKYFNIFRDEFWHNFKKHETMFQAGTKLVKLKIRYDEPLSDQQNCKRLNVHKFSVLLEALCLFYYMDLLVLVLIPLFFFIFSIHLFIFLAFSVRICHYKAPWINS